METLELCERLDEYEQKLNTYERNCSGSRMERADLREMIKELSQDLETYDMDSDEEEREPDASLKSNIQIPKSAFSKNSKVIFLIYSTLTVN